MCRVFITEDESIIAEDLKYTLLRSGYEVVGMASSGNEAITKIEIARPDIILMDIMLEGDLNGIETVKYINDRFAVPVIYLTAYSDTKTKNEAFETSPSGYLLKPVNEDQLLATIDMAYKLSQSKLA